MIVVVSGRKRECEKRQCESSRLSEVETATIASEELFSLSRYSNVFHCGPLRYDGDD